MLTVLAKKLQFKQFEDEITLLQAENKVKIIVDCIGLFAKD